MNKQIRLGTQTLIQNCPKIIFFQDFKRIKKNNNKIFVR